MQRSTRRGHDYITNRRLGECSTALASLSDCRRHGMQVDELGGGPRRRKSECIGREVRTRVCRWAQGLAPISLPLPKMEMLPSSLRPRDHSRVCDISPLAITGGRSHWRLIPNLIGTAGSCQPRHAHSLSSPTQRVISIPSCNVLALNTSPSPSGKDAPTGSPVGSKLCTSWLS